MQAAPIQKELKRSMTLQRKSTKQAYFSLPMSLSKNSTFTPLSCKAIVCRWTINLIIDSESSISVISKKFLGDIGQKPMKVCTRTVSNIHGQKKLPIGIVEDILITVDTIKVQIDM